MSETIDYTYWADEYEKNASNIQITIDKRKEKLKTQRLTADQKKTLENEIIALQAIRREHLNYSAKIRKYARNVA